MSRPHWYVRPWPNLGLGVSSAFSIGVMWAVDLREPTGLLGGSIVGILDALLGLLAYRATAVHLRAASTFVDVIRAYGRSRWTQARNGIGFVGMVVAGIVVLPNVADRAIAAIGIFAAYAAVSFFFRAVQGIWIVKEPRSHGMPANSALERTREG